MNICIINLIIINMYNQNSNNLRALYDFLAYYKVDVSNNCYTHVSFGPPYGKFNIPDDKIDEFMVLYENCVGYSALHLAEKVKPICPLMIDVDFNMTDNKRQYSYGDIENIIELTNNIIKKKFAIENDTLLAHVLEKSEQDIAERGTINTTYYRDGFHIMYPYFMTTQDMKFEIIKELKQECKNYNIFEYFKIINTSDEIIDDFLPNILLMYGSQKNNGPLYKLTRIYNNNLLNIFDGADEPLRDHAYLVTKLSNRKYCDYNIPAKKDMINILNDYGYNYVANNDYNYNLNEYDENDYNNNNYNLNNYEYNPGEYEKYERIANGDDNNEDDNNEDDNNEDDNDNEEDNNEDDEEEDEEDEEDDEEDEENDECGGNNNTNNETNIRVNGNKSSKSLVFKNCKNCKFYIY